MLRRLGEAVWPTEIEFRFEGGKKLRRVWDGRGRWIRYRITGPKLLWAAADPDRKDLLDVDETNNGLTVEPDEAAGAKWAHRTRFWAQNLIELFSMLGFVR